MNWKLIFQTIYVVGIFNHFKAFFTYRHETRMNATIGEKLRMYCFGSILDQIVIRRNGEVILTLAGSDDPDDFSGRYSVTKAQFSRGSVMMTVEIPAENMTEEEHNSRWECIPSYRRFWYIHKAYYRSVLLYLQVPVNATRIINAPQSLTFVKEGYELSCLTAGVRPPATITWYIDGQEVENTTVIDNTVTGDDVSLFNITSTLTILGDISKKTRTIYCEGYNIQGFSPVQSTPIQITTLFNPGEPPHITGYTSGTRLLPSDPPLVMSCKIRKSWPHPTMSWICPFYVNEEVSYTDGHMAKTIQVKVDADLDGQTCNCVVTHSVDNYNRQASVTFLVLGHKYINSKTGIITLAVGLACLVTSLVLLIITVRRSKDVYKKTINGKDKDGMSERTDDKMTSNAQPSQQLYEEVKADNKSENIYTALSKGKETKEHDKKKRNKEKRKKARDACNQGIKITQDLIRVTNKKE